jgi:hypothetical protein
MRMPYGRTEIWTNQQSQNRSAPEFQQVDP